MGTIQIPDPVITTSVWRTETPRGSWIWKYTVDVQVGDVTVMTREYQSDEDKFDDDDYAENETEAVALALTAFGEKIRNLVGEQ